MFVVIFVFVVIGGILVGLILGCRIVGFNICVIGVCVVFVDHCRMVWICWLVNGVFCLFRWVGMDCWVDWICDVDIEMIEFLVSIVYGVFIVFSEEVVFLFVDMEWIMLDMIFIGKSMFIMF